MGLDLDNGNVELDLNTTWKWSKSKSFCRTLPSTPLKTSSSFTTRERDTKWLEHASLCTINKPILFWNKTLHLFE